MAIVLIHLQWQALLALFSALFILSITARGTACDREPCGSWQRDTGTATCMKNESTYVLYRAIITFFCGNSQRNNPLYSSPKMNHSLPVWRWLQRGILLHEGWWPILLSPQDQTTPGLGEENSTSELGAVIGVNLISLLLAVTSAMLDGRDIPQKAPSWGISTPLSIVRIWRGGKSVDFNPRLLPSAAIFLFSTFPIWETKKASLNSFTKLHSLDTKDIPKGEKVHACVSPVRVTFASNPASNTRVLESGLRLLSRTCSDC